MGITDCLCSDAAENKIKCICNNCSGDLFSFDQSLQVVIISHLISLLYKQKLSEHQVELCCKSCDCAIINQCICVCRLPNKYKLYSPTVVLEYQSDSGR